MQACRLKYDKKKVGYMKKILEVGFNGIVDIIWVVESLRKMKDKSNAEEPTKDIEQLYKRIVYLWIGNVERSKDKVFCIGLMIVGNYKKRYIVF